MKAILAFLLSPALSSSSLATKNGLRFIAIGDWGGKDTYPYHTYQQWATAQGMASVAAANPERNLPAASFVTSLGDNFYGIPASLDEDALHSRFQGTFEEVYHHEELDVPWYMIAGNHDWCGNLTAQLEYAQNPNSRWVFPHHNHHLVEEFHVDDIHVKLEIIMTDSMILAPGSEVCYEDGVVRPIPAPTDQVQDTLNWVEFRLRESDADYLLVTGHYPLYSACSNGNMPILIDNLDSLLKEYNVTAYLSGHEHCAFHVTYEDMNYITSGIGNGCYYGSNDYSYSLIPSKEYLLPEGADLKYRLSDDIDYDRSCGVLGGFLSFDVGHHNMTVNFHKEDGTVLYDTVLMPRAGVNRRTPDVVSVE